MGGRRRRAAGGGLLVAVLVMALVASSAQAATSPLRSAANFAVLAGSTVTNTGPSVLSGDVGVSPGRVVTGFPPGTVRPPGAIHGGDSVAAQGHADLTTLYDTAAGFSAGAVISADLAGRTLAPGVYKATSSLALNGTLTLDAKGNPNAGFVFQAGSTLGVGTSAISRVLLINGAQASNVYWQVASSATIGAGSAFAGNILARISVTMDTKATLYGRALAESGAVTLDTNTINTPATTPVSPPRGSAARGTTASGAQKRVLPRRTLGCTGPGQSCALCSRGGQDARSAPRAPGAALPPPRCSRAPGQRSVPLARGAAHPPVHAAR